MTDPDDSANAAESSIPSFSAKLDSLFKVVRPLGGDREYSYKEVAAAITERGGPPTTANYIYLLRSGRRDNPGKRLLEALADFFGTDVGYFYDTSSGSGELHEQMQLIAQIRQSPVHSLALRSILDVSPASMSHVLGIIDQVKKLEGLPRGTPPPADAWTGENARDEADGSNADEG